MSSQQRTTPPSHTRSTAGAKCHELATRVVTARRVPVALRAQRQRHDDRHDTERRRRQRESARARARAHARTHIHSYLCSCRRSAVKQRQWRARHMHCDGHGDGAGARGLARHARPPRLRRRAPCGGVGGGRAAGPAPYRAGGALLRPSRPHPAGHWQTSERHTACRCMPRIRTRHGMRASGAAPPQSGSLRRPKRGARQQQGRWRRSCRLRRSLIGASTAAPALRHSACVAPTTCETGVPPSAAPLRYVQRKRARGHTCGERAQGQGAVGGAAHVPRGPGAAEAPAVGAAHCAPPARRAALARRLHLRRLLHAALRRQHFAPRYAVCERPRRAQRRRCACRRLPRPLRALSRPVRL